MSLIAEERFRALHTAHFRDLLGFALRRTATADDAADVVADTFVVAWRRLDEVPPGNEGRLWLYGVCRRTLANHTRSGRRRERLGAKLGSALREAVVPDPADEVLLTVSVRAALAALRPADRELLALSIWEQLEPGEIAVVLDLPARTVRTRLSRARARLRHKLGGDGPPGDGHVLRDGGAVLPTRLAPGEAR
ncbi:hypothetical protein ASG90_09885 [Nocardioides sp. Soil797]|nr:hypothetical protein ASG90_09885 [Nocardioides sp. Soil797]